MAIWKEELYGTRRCVNCGFLGKRSPEIDEAKNEIVRKEIIPSPGHQPGLLPVWLAEQGVSVIIASGMGSRAQGLFRQNRIKVIINVVETNPEKAVLDYIGGRLEVGDDVCDH